MHQKYIVILYTYIYIYLNKINSGKIINKSTLDNSPLPCIELVRELVISNMQSEFEQKTLHLIKLSRPQEKVNRLMQTGVGRLGLQISIAIAHHFKLNIIRWA